MYKQTAAPLAAPATGHAEPTTHAYPTPHSASDAHNTVAVPQLVHRLQYADTPSASAMHALYGTAVLHGAYDDAAPGLLTL